MTVLLKNRDSLWNIHPIFIHCRHTKNRPIIFSKQRVNELKDSRNISRCTGGFGTSAPIFTERVLKFAFFVKLKIETGGLIPMTINPNFWILEVA